MNKRILILVNHEIVVYNFRKELVIELLSQGYEVYISSPPGKKIDLLVDMGAKHIDTQINRHGIGVLEDYRLMRFYSRMMRDIKPMVVLTYTIKPNIYGGFAAKKNKIPYVANITGLGSAVEKPGILQFITISLYKRAFSKIKTVYLQNEENMKFFINHNISIDKLKLLPGSGVNLDEFQLIEYPKEDTIRFAFISRVMKSKGIDLYLESAKKIKLNHPNTEFHVCGFCEEDYITVLEEYQEQGIVIYHGMVDDISAFLSSIHCLIHPSSYPEGMSNVLLEAAASGRPVITTDRSGCKEVVDENFNGFVIAHPYDTTKLFNVTTSFLQLSHDEKRKMGLNGRNKMIKQFDRKIVLDSYLKEIEELQNELTE